MHAYFIPVVIVGLLLVALVTFYIIVERKSISRLQTGFAEQITKPTRQRQKVSEPDPREPVEVLPEESCDEPDDIPDTEEPVEEEYVPAFMVDSNDPAEALPWDE